MSPSCIPRNGTDLLPLSTVPIYTRPKIVQQALRLMEKTIRDTPVLTSPQAVRDYLRLRLADRPHEVFGVLFLTAQHQVIEFVEMFRGTLTQTSVYPREVVIEALSRNAAAVILTHNHPSGKPDPSAADEVLTHAIKAALAVVDVDVLDHFIVTRRDVYGFAENRKL
ncbi:DNA repair protein RadC [uncultured Acidovorax sp.]|uniref:RadC family protein n=1 Tax=uncultured Acidovorax sp. TaxID=158751 RepID=UPI0025843E6E|nr:DNA repair protein RadC [uncultured Acidovorax sp.]